MNKKKLYRQIVVFLRNNIKIAGCIIFSVSIISCESDLKYDLEMDDFNPQIAVNCTFTNDSTWRVFISKSSDIMTNDNWVSVEDAVVSITDTNGNIITLEPVGKGQYNSQQKPRNNESYQLNISVAGFENIEATDFMPEQIKIDAVTVVDSVSIVDSAYQSAAKISITDNGNTKNYYQIIIYQIDSNNLLLPLWLESDDLSFENTVNSSVISTNPIQEYLMAKDELFNGTTHTFYITFSRAYAEKEIYTEIRSLSPDLYEYALSFSKSAGNIDNPFIEPIKVYNNIKNGLGIFGGFTSDILKIEN